jgi:hypothetical protein
MALKPDPEAVRRWVEESCRAQGIEAKVTDPKTVEKIAVLLRESRKAASPRQAGAVRG